MKNLSNKKGTIAAYLTRNRDKIFACGNNIDKMKEVVLELLRSEEIKDNPATAESIKVLSRARGNAFLSTLITYMTGLKVGR